MNQKLRLLKIIISIAVFTLMVISSTVEASVQLVAHGDKCGVFLAVIPGGEELDLKAAATATGNKKVEMVPLKDVHPLTGYIRGGVSPIGTKKPYPVYLDETALGFQFISVSAGQRGMQVLINPDDLIKVTNATTSRLAKTAE